MIAKLFNRSKRYKKDVHTIHCPMCSTEKDKIEMEYRTVDDTHAWICPECPNVMLEFHFTKNIDDLKMLVK